MAITPADSRSSDSGGVRDVSEKETHHQEIDQASSAIVSSAGQDPNDGKLNKDIVMAYIVSPRPARSQRNTQRPSS